MYIEKRVPNLHTYVYVYSAKNDNTRNKKIIKEVGIIIKVGKKAAS